MAKFKVHYVSIIVYIIFLLTLIALVILLEQPFLLVFSLVLFILPAVLLPLFFSSVKKPTVLLESDSTEVFYSKVSEIPSPFREGKKIKVSYGFDVTVSVDNPTYCPFFLCDLKYTINNLYYPNNFIQNLSVHVLPKYREDVIITADVDTVGMIRIDLLEVAYTDLLHFFTYVVPLKNKLELPVIPEENEASDLPVTPAADGLDEYTESDLKGEISSDVKEIRQYQPGDRLQRIHWKLSAKLDELFVKEMAHTSVLSLVLLPELNKSDISATAATLLGCIKELNKREQRFEVCLYNHTSVDFTFYTIVDDEETLREVFIQMYYLPLYDEPFAAKHDYYAAGEKNATIISIHGDDFDVILPD